MRNKQVRRALTILCLIRGKIVLCMYSVEEHDPRWLGYVVECSQALLGFTGVVYDNRLRLGWQPVSTVGGAETVCTPRLRT